MSNGQRVLNLLIAFFNRYLALPDPAYALVLALWAMHTWFTDDFDATPYLCITGVRGSGKSRVGELLKLFSRHAFMGGARPAAVYRALKALDGKLTLLIDEAEAMSSSSANFMREIMNTGYRKGQTQMVTMPGGQVEFFPVYCPKVFMLIGDLTDTLRSRSIVLRMQRGRPAHDYQSVFGESEAAAILHEMQGKILTHNPTAAYPEFLSGRDREIWGAVFGMAYALGLDKATVATLDMIAADLASIKTADATYFGEMERNAATQPDEYAEVALRDLASVIDPKEPAIFSSVAVQRMKAIPTGPWRTFKGAGLNEILLGRMVSALGVVTNQPVRMGHGRTAKKLKGYRAANVREALAKLGGAR